MPATNQLLVNVITATVPGNAVSYAVAHGLRSNSVDVAPTLILPGSQSTVTVASSDATNVYFANSSATPATVSYRVEHGLSNEVDSDTLTPFVVATGTGAGNVTSVGVQTPIVNVGSLSAPIIGLANKTPNPAGTYGSSAQIPVVTVDAKGLVTGVTLAANPSAAIGAPYTVDITDAGFVGLTPSGFFPIPVNTDLVIVNDKRTVADPSAIKYMPYIDTDDLGGNAVPVGRRIVIYCNYDFAPPNGYYFTWVNFGSGAALERNLMQGDHAANAASELATKQFNFGDSAEIMYVGSGRWKMLSFQKLEKYFF